MLGAATRPHTHRTAYYDSKGQLVCERWRIARHYLRSWFVLDVICVIPYDLLTQGTMEFLSMLKVGPEVVQCRRVSRPCMHVEQTGVVVGWCLTRLLMRHLIDPLAMP